MLGSFQTFFKSAPHLQFQFNAYDRGSTFYITSKNVHSNIMFRNISFILRVNSSKTFQNKK